MPETLEKCLVHPCGFVLRGIWKIVSLFFDSKTRAKVAFLGSEKGFDRFVDVENLPPSLGGSLSLPKWPKHDDDEDARILRNSMV